MHWYRPLPSVLWWSLSAAAVVMSVYVLVFLARHPVDGESRIIDWSQRNRGPLVSGGGVLVFLVMPNSIILAALLGLFLWIEHTGEPAQLSRS